MIKIDEKKKFGERLSELRKKKKASQAEVADYIELTVAAYQNYENGRREAGYDTISKLADFYGVTTDYLLGRSGAKPPEDPIIALCDAFHLPEQDRAIVAAYLYMSDKDRAELLRLVKKLAESAEPKPQENSSGSISVSTTLGEIEDSIASEEEAHAKDSG